MFILVIYGYKQQKVFTIDVLTASLIDCIYATCIKDIIKLFADKNQYLSEQVEKSQAQLEQLEKTIEQLDKQIQEEQSQNADKAEQNKENKKDTKKGGKVEEVKSQAEIDRAQSETQKATLQNDIKKLQEKLQLQNDNLPKYKEYTKSRPFNLFMELQDMTGERKYVKTKMNDYANTFLTDKTSYQIGILSDQNDEVNLLLIDGYQFRTPQEDVLFAEEEAANLANQKANPKDVKKAQPPAKKK